MRKKALLHLVEPPSTEEFEITPVQVTLDDCHSLNTVVEFRRGMNPQWANKLVATFVKKGMCVLDPWCGAGNVLVETALREAVPIGCDTDPLSLAISSAKLSPVDLVDTTLYLQSCQLNKPFDLSLYSADFKEFYEVNTFRELVNLRNCIKARYTQTSKFIELLTLGILHGHTAGYLSSYALTSISLSPEEQKKMNLVKGRYPEYRSVVPRILKRASASLIDGNLAKLNRFGKQGLVAKCQCYDLFVLEDNSVDLIITKLPSLRARDSSQWLREWFIGMREGYSVNNEDDSQLPKDWIKQAFLEFARIIKRRGYIIMGIPHEARSALLEVIDIVSRSLKQYWKIERAYAPVAVDKKQLSNDISHVLVIERR